MSLLEERSAKRQRRSYSPDSPAAETKDGRVFVQPPHTPPPSVRMSPSWSAAQPQPTAGSVTFPTPPSTASFQSKMQPRASSEGGDSGRHTPVADEGGAPRSHGDADVDMADEQAAADVEGDLSMAEDAGHRRTDHEREGKGDDSASQQLASEALPKGIYKLSTEPMATMRPLPDQDVITLYNLERIRASVARKDPVTGQKINKLRKSYAGKTSSLGIEGRNKVETTAPEKTVPELSELVNPDWDLPAGPDGKSLWDAKMEDFELGGPNTDQLMAKLDRAFDLKPGRLPKEEHNEWKSILGLDDPRPTPSVGPTAVKTAAANAISKTNPLNLVRNSAPASPRGSARPDRTGKKRKYDESSYTGYQEGYEDDGYIFTGGVDGSGAKRQRRKVSEKAKGFYASLEEQ